MGMRARKIGDYETDKMGGLKGKHGNKMDSMFDKKQSNKEAFHKEVSAAIENNKKVYDRQLYADWLTKVYDRCQNACIKVEPEQPHSHAQLREIEMVCGRNCVRKHDKVYKLYYALEGKILQAYCEEHNIDDEAFMKEAQKTLSTNMESDQAAGMDALIKG